MPLDRGAQRLLKILAVAGGNAAGPRTAATRRRALEMFSEAVEAMPEEPVETHDLAAPGPAGVISARLYRPAGAISGGIVYLHGGGWVAGGLSTHDGVCRRLALGSRLRVLAIDYRLAPEHPFPAAYDDALAALRWTVAHADTIGIDPSRVVVAGDSAGAGLAAALALGRDGPAIALQLLICPILSPAETSASRAAFADGYFLDSATLAADLADYLGPDSDPRDPRISPLLAADLTGSPPAIVHTAEYDPFRDEGEAYAQRLKDAGVAVRQTRHDGMIHYFYAMPRAITGAADAVAAIGMEVAISLDQAVRSR
jgi:acetyl esterase/lipase